MDTGAKITVSRLGMSSVATRKAVADWLREQATLVENPTQEMSGGFGQWFLLNEDSNQADDAV